MQITTEALVLHALRYGDADLIVKLYTRTYGIRSYHIRNAFKRKKSSLKIALFQPLSQLRIQAVHRDKGTLERLTDVKSTYAYGSVTTHVVKTSIALFLSEVLNESIKEEEANFPLFDFLSYAFKTLDKAQSYSNFHLVFLIELSKYMGFYPDTSTIDAPVFSLEDGFFGTSFSTELLIKPPEVAAFKTLLGTKFDDFSELQIPKMSRNVLLNHIITYFELHLQSFRKPKSLAVFNDIFQS